MTLGFFVATFFLDVMEVDARAVIAPENAREPECHFGPRRRAGGCRCP